MRICSFLCAVGQPKLILPHAAYRHHYAEEFPAVSATAAHRECECGLERERGGEETCSTATLADEGQSWIPLWIFTSGCAACVYKDNTAFMGFIADLCAPDLCTYVRGNSVYLCVCVCESVSDCVAVCVNACS